MSDTPPVRGVLVAHGSMARGMMDAMEKIAGTGEEVLTALSNEGLGPGTLQEKLDDLLGDSPAVVFTDLSSGSCALAARICCRERGARAVITGVNLPMLLDFVFNRHLPLGELVPRLLAKGRESLTTSSDN